jgi:glycosyltransferase involved in cell wall biosynthesis
MRILFDHTLPFLLCHGGQQIQIQETRKALEGIGLTVDFMRWWDDAQVGDVIHFFGRPTETYVDLAHQKKIRVVIADQHSGLGARAPALRQLQKAMMTAGRHLLPRDFTARMAWNSYLMADACLGLSPWDLTLLQTMFNVEPTQIVFVPNGIEDAFLNSTARPRGPWLLSASSIVPIKRVLETSQAAVEAGTPIHIVGQPLSESAPYYQRFLQFARNHPDMVRYQGPVHDRTALARLYREARGFVLLSCWESFSLAAHEASACECPLLISDLLSLRGLFGNDAVYGSPKASIQQTAKMLRAFYDQAPSLAVPPKPKSWNEVARILESVYKQVLARPAAS